MRPYWEILNRAFQTAVTYKFEVWMSLLSNMTYLAFNLAIWYALLHDDGSALGEMVAYVLVVQFLRNFTLPNLLWLLPERIRSGEIVMDMMKPISLPLRLIAEQAGGTCYELLRTLPVYAVLVIWLQPPLPGLPNFGAFTLAAVLGYAVVLMLSLILLSSAFWILEGDSLVSLLLFGIAVFSGQFIPMWYLPDWLVRMASWLPFQAVFYTPAAIFSERLSGAAMWQAVGVQAVWLVVLGAVMFWLWHRAVRKVVIQGG